MFYTVICFPAYQVVFLGSSLLRYMDLLLHSAENSLQSVEFHDILYFLLKTVALCINGLN